MGVKEDIAATKRKMLEKMEKIMRANAIACFQEIIVGSPVDSGRFRANWQASVNNPVTSIQLNGIPSKRGEDGKVIKNQFPQTADVVNQTSRYTLNGILYLTNNLPYAERLENGWSAQRGAGWVAQSVENAKANIKRAFEGQ